MQLYLHRYKVNTSWCPVHQTHSINFVAFDIEACQECTFQFFIKNIAKNVAGLSSEESRW